MVHKQFNIGDFLIEIKNASRAHKASIIYRNENSISHILKILYNEGLINGYKYLYSNTKIEILFKYSFEGAAIKDIEIISKPGRRIYYTLDNILAVKYKNPSVLYIISTPFGIVSSNQAISYGTGGEVICSIT